MRTRFLLQLMVCIAVASCSARQNRSTSTAADGNAIIVQGADLGNNLLDGLRTRIPALTISARSGQCPLLTFRGMRSMRNQNNPTIYVDDTRVQDTCVLTEISTAEIDYVEVYPSGITSRAEVQRNPFGVILIYRVRS